MTKAQKIRPNWSVFIFGFAFWLLETNHFGWNGFPQSDAEVICDGIAMLITSLAFINQEPQK